MGSYAASHRNRSAESRIDALEQRLQDLSSLLQANSLGSQAPAEQQLRRCERKLKELEHRFTEAHQENHYVHQHNASLLLQLGQRLQSVQSQLAHQQTGQASTSSHTALATETETRLARVEAQLRQYQEQLATCSDAASHSQRVAVSSASKLQHLEEVLTRGLAEVQTLVASTQAQHQDDRRQNTKSGVDIAAAQDTHTHIDQGEMSHSADHTQDTQSLLARLSALEARLSTVESRKTMSVHDAQRLFQYTAIITGIQGGLQASVTQLQTCWSRAAHTIETARDRLHTADSVQKVSRKDKGVAALRKQHDSVLIDLGAAHEAVMQTQAAVEHLAEQMTKAQLVSQIAYEKFAGKAVARLVMQQGQSDLIPAQPLVTDVDDKTREAVSNESAGPTRNDLQTALQELATASQLLAARLAKDTPVTSDTCLLDTDSRGAIKTQPEHLRTAEAQRTLQKQLSTGLVESGAVLLEGSHNDTDQRQRRVASVHPALKKMVLSLTKHAG